MQTFYVHKLRLEANEGARVEIDPVQLAPPQGGWIAVKSIVAVICAASVLIVLATVLS